MLEIDDVKSCDVLLQDLQGLFLYDQKASLHSKEHVFLIFLIFVSRLFSAGFPLSLFLYPCLSLPLSLSFSLSVSLSFSFSLNIFSLSFSNISSLFLSFLFSFSFSHLPGASAASARQSPPPPPRISRRSSAHRTRRDRWEVVSRPRNPPCPK